MTAPQTVADVLDAGPMREVAHINGGREWFGYRYQSVNYPRLSRFDRYSRKSRDVTSTWRVDGGDCQSLADAVDRLDSAPSLSVAELQTIGLFTKPLMAKSDFPDFRATYDHLRILAEKGLVWWEAGKVTLLYEAAAIAIDAAESNASGKPAWDAVSPAVEQARAALRAAATSARQGETR